MPLPTNRVLHSVAFTIHRLFGRRPYRKGLFPLSGDPVHYGHVATVEHALEMCDHVIVLIMQNAGKMGTLTLKERLMHAKTSFRRIAQHRITILTSDGVMVDEFDKHACDVLIRGVRDRKDADYERDYVEAQRNLFPWFKNAAVKILRARGAYKTISSSQIRDGVRHFVAVDRFLPVATHQALQEKIHGQYLLGVTGGIASGKTATVAAFKKFMSATYGVPVYSIAIDELLREIYDVGSGCDSIRDALAKRFGAGVLNKHRSGVNRAVLAVHLFVDTRKAAEDRRFVEDLTLPAVRRLFRGRLKWLRGLDPPETKQLILIEWAQPVASGLARWSNNNTIVIGAPDAERAKAFEQRQIPPERLAVTRAIQGTSDEIATSLARQIDRDCSGRMLWFVNRWLSAPETIEQDYRALAEKIFGLFPGLKSV